MMRKLRVPAILLVLVLWTISAFASAYNAQPKLVVIVVIDQLRGDLLERYHDDFAPGGFRRLMDEGAWFTSCYYNYAATKTAPGHSTIGTGTYTLGHGILANEWWDPQARRMVTSVEDENTRPLGLAAGVVGEKWSSSPHNLLTDTIGDELKLATKGRAKVYGIALKDRAAILPVGFAANAAFFIDPKSGDFVTSTYYMKEAPQWLIDFNEKKIAASYFDREVKDEQGQVLRSTATPAGKQPSFYEQVGPTPFGNEYTERFARELIEQEKLGQGGTTDLLSVSFSSPDMLGHKVGPDSEEHRQMLLSLDRTLASFFQYLDEKVGKGQWVVALTADHGIAPMADVDHALRLPGYNMEPVDLQAQLNHMLAQQYGKPGDYVVDVDYPLVELDAEAFAKVKVNEAVGEQTVAELLQKLGFRLAITKLAMARGDLPNTIFRQQLLNTYSPHAGWYVTGLMAPFIIGASSGTTHGAPYSYDAHVPLAFYGPDIRSGVYRDSVEPIDLAPTLASLLRINKPASAVGRALGMAFVRETPVLENKEAAAEKH